MSSDDTKVRPPKVNRMTSLNSASSSTTPANHQATRARLKKAATFMKTLQFKTLPSSAFAAVLNDAANQSQNASASSSSASSSSPTASSTSSTDSASTGAGGQRNSTTLEQLVGFREKERQETRDRDIKADAEIYMG